MVYRVYAEKKPGLSPETAALEADCRSFLGIKGLTRLRVWNRYDAEGIDLSLFRQAKATVFSEPPVDILSEEPDTKGAAAVFAAEPLPGQFDQRADSAAQCIQLISRAERPLIRTAKVYALYGTVTEEELNAFKAYVINPVESREASLDKPETLYLESPEPEPVPVIEGFTALDEPGLAALAEQYGLAMDLADLRFLRDYFRDEEKREPTVTELRVVDTYWSDHCRHTTFSTRLKDIDIQDRAVKEAYGQYLDLREEVYGPEEARRRPQTLMDIATIGAKALKKWGLLPELDESEEINACSIHVPAEIEGKREDWLLMFKNETHNHPTEIEPFGGAATCIGGCIRDPLSGRAFVHQAMRVTGGGDPRARLSKTLPGKLPQRKLAITAAAGYSSYGNQIGLATGHVAELYHPGYVAKRLECGAVVAAAPAENVVRLRPEPGDVILLLGGRTGRDGIGGATGSSKSHNLQSLSNMASEVQKGNAPEERKLQRLFRRGEVTRLIKRCNDFGAGGVSVAVGELAPGLEIDLDAVRKKYAGLDGTELAISESQERMAVVVSPADEDIFIAAAAEENLECYRVAVVTEQARMVMRWRGQTVADLSRDFLDTNGAPKEASVSVPEQRGLSLSPEAKTLDEMAGSLRCASRRGLVERFDSTVGAGTLLMPFGGANQRTPAQAMAALLPVLPGQHTDTGSVMAWGCDPELLSQDPMDGAYGAVLTSLAKLVAAGGDYHRAYLSLQEFFEKLRDEPERWGKPFAALLGALKAQLVTGCAAIGGKDSMSGSFLDYDVPPTLISFAIAPIRAGDLVSPEFKQAGHPVYLFTPEEGGSPREVWDSFIKLRRAGRVKAAWAVENGLAEAVMKMSFGNGIGFRADPGAMDCPYETGQWGCIVAELEFQVQMPGAVRLGFTIEDPVIDLGSEQAEIAELLSRNEAVLSGVYPTKAPQEEEAIPVPAYAVEKRTVCFRNTPRPKALIPVFPGTNCEYDTARALLDAGCEAETVLVRNLTAADVSDSVERFARALDSAQMIVLPGGFSGGDEPEGSAKLIAAFFRAPALRERVTALLERRDGLILGICNGFQALVKLGLVPYGKILDEQDENSPTLTFNRIGRHQSMLVNTRVCSNLSPWLAGTQPGEVYTVPISHGEGRFLASRALLEQLAEKGQIATQYADLSGAPSMDTAFNPNGSVWAIEGITSPDGRVLGKMGHSERAGKHLYRNVPGEYDMKLFTSAAKYFRG